jgi:ADP-ribose pyrophosphatase YjhB (NUDIX family)
MTIHDEFIKYPTGKINTGEFCDCCKRFNSRYTTCSVIAIKDDKILFVRRGHEPSKGMWALPGGYLDWDETTKECARRELKEETGYDAEKTEFFKVFSSPKRDPGNRQNIDNCFVIHVKENNADYDKEEVSELKWFDFDNLPEGIAFDHREMVEEYRKTF